MYYNDARAAHYRDGVPRDVSVYFAKLGGQTCPECGAQAGFSTLNEFSDWDDVSHKNPMRCAVCQHEWHDE